MTQEEIEKQAEEYFCEHCENGFEHDNGHCSNCSKWDYFIAGAKWGMEHAIEWHDLRKNPKDLPEEGTEVLNDDGVKVVRINGHWRYVYGGEWEEDAYVDHWCELPQFKDKE